MNEFQFKIPNIIKLLIKENKITLTVKYHLDTTGNVVIYAYIDYLNPENANMGMSVWESRHDGNLLEYLSDDPRWTSLLKKEGLNETK